MKVDGAAGPLIIIDAEEQQKRKSHGTHQN
jgi:hypothetical protein